MIPHIIARGKNKIELAQTQYFVWWWR